MLSSAFDIAFTPDATTLVVLTVTRQVQVVDLVAGEVRGTVDLPGDGELGVIEFHIHSLTTEDESVTVPLLAISSDSKWIAVTVNKSIHVISLASLKVGFT